MKESKSGILAAHALHEQVVERTHHLLHALDVTLGHLVDHLRDVVEERLGHRLLELIEQLLELVLGLGVEELVVLQLLHLARRLLRQPLEELLLALDDAAQHVGELLAVVAALAGLGRALLALRGLAAARGRAGRALLAAGLARGLSLALRAFGAFVLLTLGAVAGLVLGALGRARTWASGLLEAVVEGPTLQIQDLLELPFDLLHYPAEIELVEPLPALLAQLMEQVTQARGAHPVGRAHATLHQVAQRVLQVPEVHQVVGQRLEDVPSVELRDLLGTVPDGVAGDLRHG